MQKSPNIIIFQQKRGFNPFIENVARILNDDGFLAFVPYALTPFGDYPVKDDDGRALYSKRKRDELLQVFIAKYDFFKLMKNANIGGFNFVLVDGIRINLVVKIPNL